MATIINLDEMLPEETHIVLFGKTHVLKAATTQMYLTMLQNRTKVRGMTPEQENTEQAIQLITLACDTLSREDLLGLPLRVVLAIVKQVEKQMTEEGDEAAAETGATGPDGGELGE